MKSYTFYYKDIYLGLLEVNAEGRHRYSPHKEGVDLVKEKVSLTREMLYGTEGFTSPIPFFSERLYYLKKSGLTEIHCHTDYFVLKKDKEIENEHTGN